MTVCIAALCDYEGKPAMVLCSDWQGTYADFVKAESDFKMRPAGASTVLLAGDSHDAEELLWHIRPVLKAYDDKVPENPESDEDFDLRISQLLSDLRAAVRKRRSAIVTHHLFLNYNIEFDLFIKEGQKLFSSDYYARILSEIRTIKLGCSVIIANVEDTDPFLVEINEDARVLWQGDFVCIGSGGLLAWAFMLRIPTKSAGDSERRRPPVPIEAGRGFR